jgi:hypothetical protein
MHELPGQPLLTSAILDVEIAGGIRAETALSSNANLSAHRKKGGNGRRRSSRSGKPTKYSQTADLIVSRFAENCYAQMLACEGASGAWI